MTAVLCERCGKSQSVYARPLEVDVGHRHYRTQRLCALCFCDWVEAQFRRAMESQQLIRAGDRVLVTLSGGKDSQLMVTLLARYRQTFPFDWVAITIDEGIAGYREIGLALAHETAQRLGLTHFALSYAEIYGLTLDAMVENAERLGVWAHVNQQVCAFCGVPRMRLALEIADRIGCNVLVSGRNLDDFVADTLLYLCTPHAPIRLNNFQAAVTHPATGVRAVNPLWKLTDKEIALYNRLQQIPYQLEPECPYSASMLGDIMRSHVQLIEGEIPGFRHAFAWGVESLHSYLNPSVQSRPPLICSRCGRTYDPAMQGEYCPDCEFNALIERLGGHAAELQNLIPTALVVHQNEPAGLK